MGKGVDGLNRSAVLGQHQLVQKQGEQNGKRKAQKDAHAGNHQGVAKSGHKALLKEHVAEMGKIVPGTGFNSGQHVILERQLNAI